ncbi:MAG TPA: BON domain-containing protein [Bryobacteraceae bacterium]|nr:BON domain-containing protein [Bryobacteraceae bacterium]
MTRFLLAIALAAALAAQTSRTAVTKKAPSAQGTSAQQDKEIEAVINGKLAKSKIGKDGFKVRVQGGVATWEGSTTVLQHKGAATRMAKSSGAKKVVNNIKVSDQVKQNAADNLDSGRRRAQVKRGEPRTSQ